MRQQCEPRHFNWGQQGCFLQNHALDLNTNTNIDIYNTFQQSTPNLFLILQPQNFNVFLDSFMHYSLSSGLVCNYLMTFSWSQHRQNILPFWFLFPFICFLHLWRISGHHEIVKSIWEERSFWSFICFLQLRLIEQILWDLVRFLIKYRQTPLRENKKSFGTLYFSMIIDVNCPW